MILISFPQSLRAWIWTLKEIVRLAAHHGTMVVHGFATPISDSTATSRPACCKWTGPRRSASKSFDVESYNMAGWRVGFCLGNPK